MKMEQFSKVKSRKDIAVQRHIISCVMLLYFFVLTNKLNLPFGRRWAILS